MEILHKCLECSFEGYVLVEKNCRLVICPTCGTENDFWLLGETPPAKHITATANHVWGYHNRLTLRCVKEIVG